MNQDKDTVTYKLLESIGYKEIDEPLPHKLAKIYNKCMMKPDQLKIKVKGNQESNLTNIFY